MANTDVDVEWKRFVWECFYGNVCIGDVCMGDVHMGDVHMGDVRMGKMANTDVGMGDLCQTISDAHCCCDGIYAPTLRRRNLLRLANIPTRGIRIRRSYRCMLHSGWRRNLVGYAHHWTRLYLPILVHNGRLLGGAAGEIILPADISNRRRFVITRYARYTTA